MYREKNSTGTFITGLLMGGIVGGVLALLFAPMTGKELRDDISKKAGDLKNNMNDLVEAGKEKAGKIMEEAKKYV